MRGKRFLAKALIVAMIAGSSMTTFAAEMTGDQTQTAGGSGQVQYIAKGDIFDIVLPTVDKTFDYLLDPSGLIAKTQTTGKRYEGVFESGKKVYFLNSTDSDASRNQYKDTSAELKVTNKSTQAVDIEVTAKIAEAEGVVMAEQADLSDGNLYMALVTATGSDAASIETKAITTAGVTVNAKIAEDPNAYDVKWDPTYNNNKGGYVKYLKDNAKKPDYGGFKWFSIKLKGDCKTDEAALLALEENPPKIDLTWTVKDFSNSKPNIANKNITFSKASGVDITVSLGADPLAATGIESVATIGGDGKAYAWDSRDYSLTDTTLHLSRTAQYIAGVPVGQTRKVKVTFNDAAKTEIELTVTVQN